MKTNLAFYYNGTEPEWLLHSITWAIQTRIYSNIYYKHILYVSLSSCVIEYSQIDAEGSPNLTSNMSIHFIASYIEWQLFLVLEMFHVDMLHAIIYTLFVLHKNIASLLCFVMTENIIRNYCSEIHASVFKACYMFGLLVFQSKLVDKLASSDVPLARHINQQSIFYCIYYWNT